MEKAEPSYEEKLVTTKDRTGIEISLLRQLPEERLSVYFNRTVPPGEPVGSAMAVAAGVLNAAYLLGQGRIGAFLFVSALSVAAGALYGGSAYARKVNREVSADVQNELALSMKIMQQLPGLK